MAQVTNNHEIWIFDVITLESPFDSVANKKIATSSMHAALTGKPAGRGLGQSTLHNAVIKAVNEYIYILNNPSTDQYAMGEDGSITIVERQTKSSPDELHVIRYDSSNGEFKGCVYNHVNESITPYQVRSKSSGTGCDGTAIFLAMLPHVLMDHEALSVFNEYKTEYESGSPDVTKCTDPMAILCDNIYRRVNSGDIKCDLPGNSSLPRLTKPTIDSGKVYPKKVTGGSFRAVKGSTSSSFTAAEALKIKDGEFHLELSRKLTPKETEMIIPIPKSHVVSAEEIRVCSEIKNNWKMPGELRTNVILLEGAAGTGKTQLAKALSSDLNIPYTKITCFSDMDKTEVMGCILPVFDGDDLAEFPENDREVLEALYNADEGEAPTEIIAKQLGLPSYMEMYYDPESSWEQLTGQKRPGVELIDCLNEVNRRTTDEWRRLFKAAKAKDTGKNDVQYRYYESEIVRAFKNGYLLEIQEPTMIRDSGILMSLVSALEPGGSMNLPGGMQFAHPDFIAVMTTNSGYEGCRKLNQALRDRAHHVEKMDLPPKEVMIERAISVTGCMDITLVSNYADAIQVLDETARKNGIKGVAGMRSLIHWIKATMNGMSTAESLKTKVINKITTDDEEIALLEDAINKNTDLFTDTRRRR